MDTMLSQQDKYKVDEAMRLIDHRFNNINWPWEALQAPGSGVKLIGDRRVIDGNKILAPLGDSLIRLFAVEAMIDSNIATKSDIDAQSQQARNNSRLVEIFDSFVFRPCVNVNPSQGYALGAQTKIDTIKAIIGAVYKDRGGGSEGLNAAKRVATKLNIL
ncbi:hypothetical protein HER10_EVM0003803 [Colletotrichum scovillei]|uniref:RNase iii n=1 Tax=Colletotrichum scovillei TaxID=1209932 RepID=A0A9P7RD26_9PEZI|nr:uncharacterized protein HER10_EVM0003803 [Colletotrichum scovillei]KAF4776135.1 hypothetical protein HER10_EVM0003803 [Colletotrichum scovillei]KAG7053404.1 RNase iii [Colletotrichum scovillei]KAG7071699.1 RNase iii [Colletotrichum scovillei]KAG7080003.1 RNase iii [Colletotrichum scovillei]